MEKMMKTKASSRNDSHVAPDRLLHRLARGVQNVHGGAVWTHLGLKTFMYAQMNRR